jgi:hypothetical protein
MSIFTIFSQQFDDENQLSVIYEVQNANRRTKVDPSPIRMSFLGIWPKGAKIVPADGRRHCLDLY